MMKENKNIEYIIYIINGILFIFSLFLIYLSGNPEILVQVSNFEIELDSFIIKIMQMTLMFLGVVGAVTSFFPFYTRLVGNK